MFCCAPMRAVVALFYCPYCFYSSNGQGCWDISLFYLVCSILYKISKEIVSGGSQQIAFQWYCAKIMKRPVQFLWQAESSSLTYTVFTRIKRPRLWIYVQTFQQLIGLIHKDVFLKKLLCCLLIYSFFCYFAQNYETAGAPCTYPKVLCVFQPQKIISLLPERSPSAVGNR